MNEKPLRELYGVVFRLPVISLKPFTVKRPTLFTSSLFPSACQRLRKA